MSGKNINFNGETIKNNKLEITVNLEQGWFDVFDRETSTMWQHDLLENSPGELSLKKKDGSQTVLDLKCAADLSVEKQSDRIIQLRFADFSSIAEELGSVNILTRISFLEDAQDFRVEVLEVNYPQDEYSFDNLVYPQRQFVLKTCEDEGYQVIPYWQGCLVPSGTFMKAPNLAFWAWDDFSYMDSAYADVPIWAINGTTMPWMGTVKEKSSYIAIFDTPDDGAMRSIVNYDMQHLYNKTASTSPYPRISSVSPLWKSQKGSFGYSRSITYHFIPGGNYVDMAKYYRNTLIKNGTFKSLKEKMKENPNLEKLLGAPLINMDGGYPWYINHPAFRFTWKDIKGMIKKLHDEDGLEKCFFIVWGGYSKFPPESYPFDEGAGTVEELKDAANTAHNNGYLFGFYHGYPSLMERKPNWDPSHAALSGDGSVTRNRWGRNCSEFYLKYAKENLPITTGTIGQMADYSDIVTAEGLKECYNPDHPTTRTQDKDNKIELFKYIKSLNLICGSECPRDFATPYVDYTKGGFYSGKGCILLTLIHVPLFNMVYHDSQILYGHNESLYSVPNVLEDIAFGNYPLFDSNVTRFEGQRKKWMNVLTRERQELLKDLALDELLSHEFLTESYDVQKCIYSSGVEIYTNPTLYDYTLPSGEVVESNGFFVKYPDGKVYKGTVVGRIDSK